MDKRRIIEKTKRFVKKKLSGAESGHDWWHTYRVWQMAKKIGRKEKADMFIVEIAALLHDIADWKFQKDRDISVGAMVAKEWLESLGADQKAITHITEIVKNISFKGAGVKDTLASIEGKVVQDADRLDAMGAIGIARTFTHGGYLGRSIYDPNIKPKKHKTFEEYKHDDRSGINHFYEKLLFLKDRMHTKTGKRLAERRHQFMKDYLNQFFAEWEGRR